MEEAPPYNVISEVSTVWLRMLDLPGYQKISPCGEFVCFFVFVNVCFLNSCFHKLRLGACEAFWVVTLIIF